MTRRLMILLSLAVFSACLSTGTPISNDQERVRADKIVISEPNRNPIDIYDDSFLTSAEVGDSMPYEPLADRRIKYQTSQVRNSDNEVKPSFNLERESPSKPKKLQEWQLQANGAKVEPSLAGESDSPNADRFASIAFNSREVRLVGPNQKEVEMKDDVASKMVVALDNLQKEATEVWGQVNEKLDKGWRDIKRSEVWGQVNDKLDKGWTDLKTMVEGVVSPSAKRQQP